MDGFLKQAAKHINSSYGAALEGTKIVFASRRAQIYFDAELSALGSLYKPTYITIDKLVGSMCDTLKVADKLTLITSLYNIYKEYLAEDSFDKFYSFGELLLSDFDTIDRYMVNAGQLYSNISDNKELAKNGDDEAQMAAINFWRTFQQSKAKQHEQKQFVRIWQSLYDIYTKFREQLFEKGIAYQGMIYRAAAENIPCATSKRYIFIGLNALSVSEQTILRQLQRNCEVAFYWDYNQSWINDKQAEAGYFIRKNLKLFPQAAGFDYAEQQNGDIKLKIVDTPSEILQCKVVTSSLDEMAANGEVIGEQTAVILTDENLLEPLLYSIPPSVSTFNISMGYPLRATLAYQFIERLISLQKGANSNGEFYHADVEQLLRHPYIAQNEAAQAIESAQIYYMPAAEIAELAPNYDTLWVASFKNHFMLSSYLDSAIELIISKLDENYKNEKLFITAAADSLKSFNIAIASCGVEISTRLYVKLMLQNLSSQKSDFEGFSGKGMQILGILESRSLDFENIIILSMSDDNFPSAKPTPSYIPITLREGFGMPSIAEHSAIWSFYFFRLLQRAKRVTMVYCSAANDSTSGQASRYIYQLKYCSPYTIDSQTIITDTVRNSLQKGITVPKTVDLSSKIYSPSAIGRYLDCPLKFYFYDVAAIKPPKVDSDETISALDTGNALHKIMEVLYQIPLKNIDKSTIESHIDSYLNGSMANKVNVNKGSALVLRRTLGRMIDNIVNYDTNISAPFKVVAQEDKISLQIGRFQIEGIADRIDSLDNQTLRVVDYKSGADKNSFKSLDALFDENPLGRNSAALQTLIYCIAVGQKYCSPTTAALYSARKMGGENFSPALTMGNEKIESVSPEMSAELQDKLKAVFESICNVEIPFSQTAYPEKVCLHCAYNAICRR